LGLYLWELQDAIFFLKLIVLLDLPHNVDSKVLKYGSEQDLKEIFFAVVR
jgi:hypothetical protein